MHSTNPTPALPPALTADSPDYLLAAIRYERSFVRRGERAIARGEDVCPEWMAGHRAELAKYEAELAQVAS